MITEKQIAEYKETVAQRFPGVWARDAARKSFDAGLELGKLLGEIKLAKECKNLIGEGELGIWDLLNLISEAEQEISDLLGVKDE